MQLTASEIVLLIEACKNNSVTKFRAGNVEFTFSGYREPLPASDARSLLQSLEQGSPGAADDWMNLSIPPAPLPDEVE